MSENKRDIIELRSPNGHIHLFGSKKTLAAYLYNGIQAEDAIAALLNAQWSGYEVTHYPADGSDPITIHDGDEDLNGTLEDIAEPFRKLP